MRHFALFSLILILIVHGSYPALGTSVHGQEFLIYKKDALAPKNVSSEFFSGGRSEAEAALIIKTVRSILNPIGADLQHDLLWYNGTLKSCGYAASIVTTLLKEALPDRQVRIGYGYWGPETDLKYHFWTEVDDRVFICFTYGQYDPSMANEVLVDDIGRLPALGLTRFDRNHSGQFSKIFWDHFPNTIRDLINAPDERFIPGFEFLWEPIKKRYTMALIEKYRGEIGLTTTPPDASSPFQSVSRCS